MSLSINVYSEYAEKLHSIEEELHAQPITEELREQIIHELDEIHEGLSELESKAVQVNRFAQNFLMELRQRAIFLYGEVDDFFYKHAVEVIEHEAEVLAQILPQANQTRIARLVDTLKRHIKELFHSYSPLLSERRAVVLARDALERAEALLQGKMMAESELNEIALAEAEVILEEIAEYLGNNDRGGLRLLWRRLTAEQRKIVRAYLAPDDLLAGLLHDVEGATHNNQVSRRR